MELHKRIKFIRLSKNLTQGYIADELAIDVANYSRLERGETAITIDRLQKIAELLSVNINDLLIANEDETLPNQSESKQLEHYLHEILMELKSINNKIKNYENN